jgi:acetylornithine/succinyldiaminopimelate/putrescine aminotransferase
MGEAIHFNTFGGNALGSAVGMAVLDVSKSWFHLLVTMSL